MTKINQAHDALHLRYFVFKILSALFLLFVFFLGISCKSHAKSEPDIAGMYTINGGGDPQGGSAIYVLPDHRFVIVFFGGASIGTWEIKDSIVLFKPKFKPAGLYIYGRNNNKLGDSTRIFFDGFDAAGGPAIGFDASTKNVRQVFNGSPNCVNFPTVGKFQGVYQKIVLAARPVDDGGSIKLNSAWHIFNFDNHNQCNDFVAVYIPEHNQAQSQDFNGKIKNGILYFDHKASKKGPLPKAKEEMKMIYQLLDTPLDPENVFYNTYFIQYPAGIEKDTLNYRFNKQKDAYINFPNYVEGEENKPQNESNYNSMSLVYQYRKLTAATASGQVHLNPKPLFIAKCKDQQ